MSSTAVKPLPLDHPALALADSALRKAEAALAVLDDAQCAPVDAIPLLFLGWQRALAAGASLGGRRAPDMADGATALDGFVEVAGLNADARAQLLPMLNTLLKEHAAMGTHDPVPAPTRRDLQRQALALRTVARALHRRVLARQGRIRFRLRVAHVAWSGMLALLMGAVVVGFTAEEKLVERGWRGEYFRNEELKGESEVRQDPEIAFFWDANPAVTGFPEDHFSARWDGCLNFEADAKVTFQLGSDDGSRLFFDGEKLIENWGFHSMRWKEGSTEVKAGMHHVRVEFMDRILAASVLLKMGLDGAAPQAVPQDRVLFPGLAPLDAAQPCNGLAP